MNEELPPGFTPKLERVKEDVIHRPADDAEQARALARSMTLLGNHGLQMKLSEGEAFNARDAFTGVLPLKNTPPAAIAKLGLLLDEYDHTLVKDAAQIRTFVTNRLIEESNDKNPQIRMKALELLGKIGDVGLFTEKTEVTIHHQATHTIEAKLREKLTILMDVEDAQVLPAKGKVVGASDAHAAGDIDPMKLLKDLE